jgi:peptidyl-tRNA hydrolase
MGGCDLFPSVLRNCIQMKETDSEIVRYCCLAIANLAENFDNRTKFFITTVADDMTRVLTSYLDEDRVLVNTCLAVAHLSKMDEIKSQFHRSGACNALVTAMQTHLMNAGTFLLIYISNFHVFNHFLLIYICKLHGI